MNEMDGYFDELLDKIFDEENNESKDCRWGFLDSYRRLRGAGRCRL